MRDTESPLYTETYFYSEINDIGVVGDIEHYSVLFRGSDVIAWTFHSYTYDSPEILLI